jgi:O-antigen/teichoic acid export membrane protein
VTAGHPGSERVRWFSKFGQVSVALMARNVLGVLGTVVAARALGPGPYGAVVLAVSATSLVATFLDLTLEEAVVHHGARRVAAGDLAGLRGLLRTALGLDIAIGVVISGLLLAFAEPLAGLTSRDRVDPTLFRLAALATLAATVDGTTGAVLLIARRTELRAWSMAGTNLVRLLCVWIAVAVGGGPAAILVAFTLAAGVGTLVQGWLSWHFGWKRWLRSATLATPEEEQRPSRGERRAWSRTLLSFGIHTSLATSVGAVNRNIVALFLGRLPGRTAVGLFDAAMLPVSIAGLAAGPVKLVLMPEQAWLWARGKRDRLRRMIRGYTIVGLAIGVAGAIAGWFMLPWLIRALYSERFASAVGPGRILLVAAVVTLATGWTKTLAGAVGRPQVRTAVSVLELALLVGLLAALAGRGAEGAAVAVSVTAVVVGAAWILTLRRLIPPGDTPQPESEVSSAEQEVLEAEGAREVLSEDPMREGP